MAPIPPVASTSTGEQPSGKFILYLLTHPTGPPPAATVNLPPPPKPPAPAPSDIAPPAAPVVQVVEATPVEVKGETKHEKEQSKVLIPSSPSSAFSRPSPFAAIPLSHNAIDRHIRPSPPLTFSFLFNIDELALPTLTPYDIKPTVPQSPTAEEKDAAQRPPIRPISGLRSKFDMELNPFEQSFSRSSHSQSSISDRTTPPRGSDATSIKHHALPPLSSLTSPAAADPSQFPWLSGQSLRTGPLSPAMLPGPSGTNGNGPSNQRGAAAAENPNTENAFDTSQFRTGFTPGAGTGFTPGYTALMGTSFNALPLPSPNTAAFLNMVTNGTPGEGADQNNNYQPPIPQPPSAIPPHLQQQHHGMSHLPVQQPSDTITPNTLSALTGMFNEQSANHQQGYFPHTIHPRSTQPPPIPSGPHQSDYVQQSANAASQAANGLFLLSQAHQELSKREEEGGPLTSKKMVNPVASKTTKRKSDASLAKPPAAKKGKKNSLGAGQSPASKHEMEMASPNFSMGASDDEDLEERTGSGPGGKETEEEKRKNFLERNRQAALKCRQRKKAWLGELQTKVENLSADNERLQQTIGSLHEEVNRLSAILMQHRDCGLVMAPAMPMAPQVYGRGMR